MMTNSNIFLSFIIPVYKVEYSQLHRCIHSIIEQKNYIQNYEILLIDDGSPDDCGKICDEYAKKYNNIRAIHQINQGLSVVRNNGVKNALGDWIAFVDGDDWIQNDFVNHAENAVSKSPAEVDIFIWDGFSETKNNSKPIMFFDTVSADQRLFRERSKEQLIDRIIPRHVKRSDISRCTDIGVTWGRIYRRALLANNNIINVPGLKVMQDSIFNLWAFEYARIISYEFYPVYHYSMYDESISKKYDSTIANTMCELYSYFADYIKRFHNEEAYWQRLYVRTVRLLVKCLAKDYANPFNNTPFTIRIKKLKNDLKKEEFETALQKCDPHNQDFKFRFILFLLKHNMCASAILTSTVFGKVRRIHNKVS